MPLINLTLVWLKTKANTPFSKSHVLSAASSFENETFYPSLKIAAVRRQALSHTYVALPFTIIGFPLKLSIEKKPPGTDCVDFSWYKEGSSKSNRIRLSASHSANIETVFPQSVLSKPTQRFFKIFFSYCCLASSNHIFRSVKGRKYRSYKKTNKVICSTKFMLTLVRKLTIEPVCSSGSEIFLNNQTQI